VTSAAKIQHRQPPNPHCRPGHVNQIEGHRQGDERARPGMTGKSGRDQKGGGRHDRHGSPPPRPPPRSAAAGPGGGRRRR
jgi:hypothetical protein